MFMKIQYTSVILGRASYQIHLRPLSVLLCLNTGHLPIPDVIPTLQVKMFSF
jgi:hypothetical protein